LQRDTDRSVFGENDVPKLRDAQRPAKAHAMTTLNRHVSTADLRESDDHSAGPSVEECPHHPYSEQAFRYFLGLERKRAERSGRSLLLLLAHLAAEPDGAQSISAVVSAKLFSGLSLCVRDVDFIGWYRHGRVAGAVLTQGSNSGALEPSEQIVERVTELVARRLPKPVADRLQVRVISLERRV
jgi:hypothetical protein